MPFIACWPNRIPAGTTSDEIVCLTDLLRTCAAIAGADVPADADEDSYDILPALLAGQASKEPIREATILHSQQGMFSLRQRRWKIVFGLGGGGQKDRLHLGPQDEPLPDGEAPEGQLYDLTASPAEQRNVWCRHPEVVQRLRALLETYRSNGRSVPAGQ